MSKHTPGPWQSDGRVGIYRAGDTNDPSNLVALVYSSDLTGNLADNARLISAAPDMAEALQKYLSSVTSDDLHDAHVMARAALKKAGVE